MNLSAFAENLVRTCRQKPLAAIFIVVVLAGLCVFGAVRGLGMNTDSLALFDKGLDFREAQARFDAQFPAEQDLIVAVIDAPSAAEAQAAADKLAAKLAPRSDIFLSVQNPTGGEFFARNGLLYLTTEQLEALSIELARAQPFLGAVATDRNARGVLRLFELTFGAANRGEVAAEQIAPAAQEAAGVIENVVDGKPAALNWAGLFKNFGPDGIGARAMVLAQPRLDLSSLEQGGDATLTIREAVRELGLTPENNVRVRLTGQIPLSDEEFASVAEGTGTSGLISVVLVGILLFMALGSTGIVVAALLTLAVGFLLTLGWATVAIGELNLISVAFAVMFVGIAVDFSIQFAMRYRAERHARGTDGLNAALDAAGFAMAKPLTLAAATTALGFFSFLPTEYRGVSQLGVIAGGGMVIALILSFTLLPALLRLMRVGGEESEVGYRWAAPFNRALVDRRKVVLGATAVLAIAAIAVLPRLAFDFDPLKLKDPTTESMSTALELMNDPLINPNSLSILVNTPDDARALAARLEALPEVGHTLTVFNIIPEDQDIKRGMIEEMAFLIGPVLSPPAAAKLPPTTEDLIASATATRDQAKVYLDSTTAGPLRDAAQRLTATLDRLLANPATATFEKLSAAMLSGFDDALAPLANSLTPDVVSLESLPDRARAGFIAQDGRYRVQAFPKQTGAAAENLNRFLKAVQTVAPDALGEPLIIYESGQIVTRAFTTAAMLALAAITILLFAVLRRAGDVARVLAPLLLASILTLATCAVMGLAINFANIIALPLLLGIGVTFPIYFVTAWRDGEMVLLASPAGRGMLYSALTTAAAFGSLAISQHTGTASLGILLTLALAYTLLTTLIFLPALLGEPPAKG
jgi:hopanoid biosynthesis associated RND transporter like protein HpnN